MTTMRRLWVSDSIYDDPDSRAIWLAEQNLSRFCVEVRRDDDNRVLVDAHELPGKSVTSTLPPATGRAECTTANCALCPPPTRLDHIVIPDYGSKETAWADWFTQGKAVYTPYEQFAWDKPLPVADDTDLFPRVRDPFPWASIGWWTGSVVLGLVAAFVITRLWYLHLGCPFLPDNGVLNACKALMVQVRKLWIGETSWP